MPTTAAYNKWNLDVQTRQHFPVSLMLILWNLIATQSSVNTLFIVFMVCCVTYCLAPASRCGDVSDPVVLDAAWSWIPPGVQTGGGFVEHNQVSGRSIRCCRMHAHTYHNYNHVNVSVLCSESTCSMDFLKNFFKRHSPWYLGRLMLKCLVWVLNGSFVIKYQLIHFYT